MNRPRGIILDLDGTVYRGDQPIPGAREAIEELRHLAYPLVFVTNAIESCAEHVEKLTQFNITASSAQIINSPLVLMRYLRHHMPKATLFAIADPPLQEELGAHFRLSEDPAEIDVVIASCDRTFNYHKLNTAFQALRRGAHFFATNIDATWPQAGGEIPDAGAVIGALEGCSQRKVELVSGKPSSLILEMALEKLDRQAGECLIVGDRLETDIVMGHRAGMRTALVLTGATQRADLAQAPIQPNYVLESVAELPQLLENATAH